MSMSFSKRYCCDAGNWWNRSVLSKLSAEARPPTFRPPEAPVLFRFMMFVCGVVCCGVVWCGVVWCGVVWVRWEWSGGVCGVGGVCVWGVGV